MNTARVLLVIVTAGVAANQVRVGEMEKRSKSEEHAIVKIDDAKTEDELRSSFFSYTMTKRALRRSVTEIREVQRRAMTRLQQIKRRR